VPWNPKYRQVFERIVSALVDPRHDVDELTFKCGIGWLNCFHPFVVDSNPNDIATVRHNDVAGGENEVFGDKKTCPVNARSRAVFEFNLGLDQYGVFSDVQNEFPFAGLYASSR